MAIPACSRVHVALVVLALVTLWHAAPAAATEDKPHVFLYPVRDPAADTYTRPWYPWASFAFLNHYGYSGQRNFSELHVFVVGEMGGDVALTVLREMRAHDTTGTLTISVSKADTPAVRDRLSTGIELMEWPPTAPAVRINLRAEPVEEVVNAMLPEDGVDVVVSAMPAHDLGALLDLIKPRLKPDAVVVCSAAAPHARRRQHDVASMVDLLGFGAHAEEGVSAEAKASMVEMVLGSLRETDQARLLPPVFKGPDLYAHASLHDAYVENYHLLSGDHSPVEYTSSSITNVLKRRGFELIDFVPSRLYNPMLYMLEPASLRQLVMRMDRPRQRRFMEVFLGVLTQHTFIAKLETNEAHTHVNDSMITKRSIPMLARNTPDITSQREDRVWQHWKFDCFDVRIPFTPTQWRLYNLVDNKSSFQELWRRARKNTKHYSDYGTFREEFYGLYHKLNFMDLMYISQVPLQSVFPPSELRAEA